MNKNLHLSIMLATALCFPRIRGYSQDLASSSSYLNNHKQEGVQQSLLLSAIPAATKKSLAEITVNGKVSSAEGEPLIGATVTVKGSTQGTTTDINGNFSLTVDSEATLVVSYIGFLAEEVPVNNRTTINIALVADIKALEEVVVIGYQTVRKKDLTGATSVVSPEAANQITAGSVGEQLQGLAPGVTVRNSGAPGAPARVEIRGVASFTDAGPLYVIDGMIADANPTISPNDIESIQILKDASAAAIYGSRAANGVIIITTKRGKEGPARINFSAKHGLQQIPKLWNVMDARGFAAMQKQQYENSGVVPPSSVADPNNLAFNTDWQDATTRLGTLSDYSVALSGGSKAGNYLISGNYFTNEGVVVGNSFDRYSLRINTQSNKGRLTFGENFTMSYSEAVRPLLANAFYDMPQLLPVIPVQDPSYISSRNPSGWGTGTPNAPSYAWNYIAMNDLFRHDENFTRAVGNAYAEFKFTDWLSYKFNAGLDLSFDFNQNIRKEGAWAMVMADEPSHVYQNRQRFHSLLFDHTLNFNKTLGRHNINGVVGYSQQSTQRDILEGRRNELQIFNGQYLTTVGSGIGEASATGGYVQNFRLYGLLGRLNYTYNDKYLLTLTGRRDVDSRFAEQYRGAFFPSVALGWRISEESFLKHVSWLSDLKLRGSYGQLGIIPSTIGSWDYTGFVNTNPRAVFGPDQASYVGALQARLANPDLRWETRISQNIGMDASFFNDRLSLSAEVYKSISKDVLVDLPVPFYTGNLGGNPYVNAGSISNSGVEMSATYRQNSGRFKWDVSGNFTTIRNRILNVSNGELDYLQAGAARSMEGRGIGEWYVLKTNGIFQSEDEVNSHNKEGKLIQPNAKPGDIRFVDFNGDGQINNDDRQFSGSPWPTLQTGAQFNASYMGFNLNVQLVGVFGHTVFNDVRRILDSYQRTNFRREVSPWTPENPNNEFPRLALDTEPSVIENNRYESDRWLEDASYVRVRNIELGYTLPQSLLSRVGGQSARVFISGQNLLTLTKYSGLDPDITGSGILLRGIDNGSWPASRVYSVGVNVEF
jgi:TonB-linked SusC/RagA family outer membrane protein